MSTHRPLVVVDSITQALGGAQGAVIVFTVIAERTTYKQAKAEIEAILTLHGLRANNIIITPGMEQPAKINRSIKITVAKDLLC